MSTLGGSRGERHAKPKFKALDINSLYKSSRGESLEPSTQKNQVPRKHGMQSLGKVPSTRRPPANLPSLKAETQIPGSVTPGQEQQSGNQISVGGNNSGSTVQQTNLNSNTNSNSISNTQTQASISSISSSSLSTSSYSSSSNTGSSSVTWSSVTTGHDAGGSSSLPPLYQSPQFQYEFPSLDGSTPGSASHKSHHKDIHQQQQQQHQQQQQLQQQQQQQQSQQNYSGRDGSGGNGNIGHQKESSGDVQQVNLRPQTDAASWIQQQQQQGGGGKSGDGHGTQQVQAHLPSVPPQYRALMPSFMYRGTGTVTSEQTSAGARSLTPPTQQQYSSGGGGVSGQNQIQQNGNFTGTQGRQRQIQSSPSPVTGTKDYRTNSPNTTSYQHHNSTTPITIQKRPQPQQSAGRGRPDQDSNSIPYIEPEVALLQRPIIKEEDLERMDSLAKDDGWIRQDDIDYNQKLVFSDDESPESPHIDRNPPVFNRSDKSSENKRNARQTDEDNRRAWSKEGDRERERENKEKQERENLERQRNERNEREHRPIVVDNCPKPERERDSRDRDRERELETSGQQSLPQRQQNGHRGLDAGVFERAKQRKEEEEKRELERKQSMTKKLQELEKKKGTKKAEDEFEESKPVSTEDDYSSRSGRPYRENKDIRDSRDSREIRDNRDSRDMRDARDMRDNRDRDNRELRDNRDIRDNRDGRDMRDSRDVRENRDNRDYGRYDKYERDINQRERDCNYKDNYSSGGPPLNRGSGGGNKNSHFQSNLPPRFLRQQQERNSSASGNITHQQTGSGPSATGSNANNRSITANHQQSQHYHHSSSDSGQKPAPFSQQYDPRYIHNQNYKQMQPLRRNPSDETMPSRRNATDNFNMNNLSSSRRRGDSEDDDRFSNSGRESISRNSANEQQPLSRAGNVTPQLARSISDSSQRKTSVSSSDEQKPGDSVQSQSQPLPQRSESRDIGSWAEETDAEMRRRRESVSSENNQLKQESCVEDTQSQPKQILQRPQTKSSSESVKKEDTKSSDSESKKDENTLGMSSASKQSPSAPTQILRRSESPKAWSECVAEEQEKEARNEKSADSSSITEEKHSAENSTKKLEGDVETKETEKSIEETKKENEIGSTKKESAEEKADEAANKPHHAQKRPSPRGGRQDIRGPSSRGYGMYRGGGSWSRRGGSGLRVGGGGRNYNEHWSESDNSDDIDDDYGRRSERSPKVPRKDNKGEQNSRTGHSLSSKEGFAPRGEPSRRGRGGSGSGSSSYRRGGMSSQGPKRMDSYGSQSSKTSFNTSNSVTSSHEEKTDKAVSDRKTDTSTEDKTKLNQMALSAGLSTKKSSECIDDSKNRDKGPQPLPKREDKKSPPKSFGGPQFQTQSQGSRKDSTSSCKNEIQNSSTSITTKKDDDSVKKESPAEAERKKSLSKEKEIIRDLPPQQRSNSSGHISSGRSSHIKKDDRNPQKPITKPPPGLGYKQSSNLNQSSQQQPNQQHKEQPLTKSKSSSDTRNDNRSGSKTNLPPRLAKQWENRKSRDGIQNDSVLSQQQCNNNSSAWEKPLQQPTGPEANKNQSQESESKDFNQQHLSHQQSGNQQMSDPKQAPTQKSDSNISKSVLDASSAPVNTIIFENTNYKTVQAPLKRQVSNQSDATQNGQKKSDEMYKSQSSSSIQEIQVQQQTSVQSQQSQMQQQSVVHQAQQHQSHNQQQQEAITTALSQMTFSKTESDYDKDIKLGFAFDTEFSHLTDDKSTTSTNKPGLCLPRSSSVIHSASSASQNTISPSTVDLNMKIASVKKVWESVPSMPPVLEHTGVTPSDAESHLSTNFVASQHQQHLQHFAAAAVAAAQNSNMHMQHALSSPGPPSYGNTFDPSLDPHFGNKDSVVVGNSSSNAPDAETGGYSPSPQHVVGSQAQHQGNAQTNLALKHAAEALSSNNGNVCKVKPTQQQMHQSGLGLSPPPAMQQGTTQLHQAPQPFYQPSQFGAMPTIPSPPAVLFNSSPMPSQGGLYAPFQIEAGRSQFSQFPGHYGTAGGGPYSAYMQTAPNMQTAPAPDMYPSLTSQFRMGGAVQTPFNQSQQLNNPSTVLISSSSNSLMSASVKPSSQQIGAIGSKSNAAAVAAAASVGQPYSQQYMNLYPPQQAPPQLQSNSYYSNSAGGQGAFFGGPTAAGATQSYGLQAAAGIFGGHGGPAPSTAPPQQQIANFSSQFINSQLLTAATLNQFRGAPTPQATTYMKSNQGQNHMQDSMGRQLKSPLGTDVSLNLAKQVQPQQSPPHHKNYAPSWDIQNQVMQQQQSQNPQNRTGTGPNSLSSGRPGQGPQRYPAPIQRPTNYPTHQPQTQQPQSQRSVRQPHSGPGGPINKHYYGNSGSGGGRGSHSSNPVDQNKTSSDKNLDTTNNQQDISVKEDNSND